MGLWTEQSGRLVLGVKQVDRKSFSVEAVEDYTFIHPRQNKWDWAEEELRLRSLVVDQQGLVVSSGFPKFFNAGERPVDDALLATALETASPVHFTEKLDGTLIIRSILPDGRILFRTRGSFDGGDFGIAAERLADSLFPALLDPSLFQDCSLLFEYVAPTNRVVIGYEQEDLWFLGAILHSTLRLASLGELEALASAFSLRLVPLVTLPRTLKGLQAAVREWTDKEGVVVRFQEEQRLIKVKSARYLALHAMRAHMSYELVVEYARGTGIETEEALEAGLRELGYDYELIQIAKMHFQVYVAGLARYRAALETAKQMCGAMLVVADEQALADARARRKHFAMQATRQPDPMRPALFALYDGKQQRAEGLLYRWYVLERNR